MFNRKKLYERVMRNDNMDFQIYVSSFMLAFLISSADFINYARNFIDPVDVTFIKTAEGVISLEYKGGKHKSEVLFMHGRVFNCGRKNDKENKGCKGIPHKFFHYKARVDYISMPSDFQSVADEFPLKITSEKFGESVVLINDPRSFADKKISGDMQRGLFMSAFVLISSLLLVKYINHLSKNMDRKIHGRDLKNK